MSYPAIEIGHLSKRYLLGGKQKRELWALRDLSLSVPRGTLLGIIGPNGAGKTTLLKVLSRVTPPTAGGAIIRGRVVSLLEVGAAFQPDLSGRENVELNAAMFGIARPEVMRRLDDIASFAGLEDRLEQPVKKYSSGMYLRLAFSMAINMEPDVLLADEILAVGDAAFQERCLRRVEEDGQRGLTVLFVSHDMAAVRRICGRTAWLDAGQIVDEGPTDEITERYESQAWSTIAEQAGGERETSPLGRLLQPRIATAGGDELGAVRTSDEFDVRIRFATSAPLVSARCAIVVRTGPAVAFRSAEPAATRLQEPGVYEAAVRIPGGLLADVVYSVKIGVVLADRHGERTLARENALSFRVFDVDSTESLWTAGGEGVVRPRLSWEPPVTVPNNAVLEAK